MHRFEFRSPKGGQGCTTTCAMVAVQLARLGLHVHIASPYSQDIWRALGIAPTDGLRVQHEQGRITITENPDHHTVDHIHVRLLDVGTHHLEQQDPVIWVMQNCYLAVVNMVGIDYPTCDVDRDRLVLVRDSRRALDTDDILTATGFHHTNTVVVDLDPVIARAVDAGFMIGKQPPASRALTPLVTDLIGAAA